MFAASIEMISQFLLQLLLCFVELLIFVVHDFNWVIDGESFWYVVAFLRVITVFLIDIVLASNFDPFDFVLWIMVYYS